MPAGLFSRTWSEKQFFLIGMGDSVTAGFGARHGYSYFDRLVSNPPDESADMNGVSLRTVLPHLQSTNLAVSGSTSGQHTERQLPRLPGVGSNIVALVVMTTGGNDLIHNYGRTPPQEEAMYGSTWEQTAPWITNFEQRLNSMIEQITSHFPAGCHIFLANIFDPTDGAGDVERAGLPAWKDGLRIVAAYNGVIQRCTEKHPVRSSGGYPWCFPGAWNSLHAILGRTLRRKRSTLLVLQQFGRPERAWLRRHPTAISPANSQNCRPVPLRQIPASPA